ncbi:MAG: NAD(P) transhydrogenase subunit alpha [Acidimicrobiia bacterium]
MRIRVHRDATDGERRVALTPKTVTTLIGEGHSVAVPAGVGQRAGFPDAAYRDAGADVFAGTPEPADLLVGVGPFTPDDIAGSAAVIGFLDPLGEPDRAVELAATGATLIALEMIPRTTLAQSMDALSSQANVAGYQAVLLAASELPRFFPMLITAAGTIRPSRVLVLGAGVAGLQAIATARRLGAAVSAYDIRPEAREQIESLGASFVGGPVSDAAPSGGGYATEVNEETRAAQQQALADAVAAADVVISTAAVPGRRAPTLVTAAMVEAMKPGSLIVDLAASTGGNCELTRAGEVVDHDGVVIHGPLDLSSRTAGDASEMLGKNILALISHLAGDGELSVEGEIGREACIARDGRIVSDRVAQALGSPA